ncbi:MAG TPA: hypothetical protein VFM23_06435 [Gemmatimonadales bacterium]|nr:hypothetical protein [Gemmatimonadales bacterium]
MRFPAWMLLVACAIANPLPAQQADSGTPRPRPKPSSTLITEDEIERAGSSVASAFDAVQFLRPRWLRSRASLQLPGRDGQVRVAVFKVYVDDHDMGGLDFLKSLPAEQVYTMRYMSEAEVGARYGPTSGPGIIVTLRH